MQVTSETAAAFTLVEARMASTSRCSFSIEKCGHTGVAKERLALATRRMELRRVDECILALLLLLLLPLL